MEVRSIGSEVRLRQNEITGLASVFYDGTPGTEYQLWAGAVERISPSAFDRALEEKHDVRCCFNHDPNHLLGRLSAGTLILRKESKGLRYSVPFDESDEDHRRVRAKIERGDLSGSSFQFRVRKEKWLEENGVDVRWVEDVDLIELGPVTFPAYDASSVQMRTDQAKQSHEQYRLARETKKRLENFKRNTT